MFAANEIFREIFFMCNPLDGRTRTDIQCDSRLKTLGSVRALQMTTLKPADCCLRV